MKKEILKLTGLTEAEFYKMYPTPDAFASAYPGYKKKLGGLTEAFPQIATADNFFSYGVPVPPTYYMSGGPVYPQIQTEAQFFSPVYSNSNNAYAVGGSYMEAYPQAKVYPQGPLGGSAFYMMQDGGAPMEEPSKDQTFYTQKMNDFFDKLRQASYKNMMNGIINSEPDTTSAIPELSMGRRGGMLSYQSNTSTGQTTTPAAAAATTTTTTQQPNFQMVTGADGQSYLVGPNNQLYSPYKGNQTTTTNNQQQQRVNYYPYKNSNGVYVGTGLDSVANFLIPNNQRQQYRNIREQQGMGIGDLTPEQLEAIRSGSANIAEINYDTRRALFPKNRLKSMNIKFRTPMPGQAPTTASNTSTNPASAATTTSTTNPASTTTTSPASTTTTTNPSATTTSTTTSQAAPKDVELDDGSYVTADEAKAKGYTQNPNGSWSKASTPATSSQQNVNAVVAQMQADARAKGMANASFEGDYSDEDLLPADERAAIQNQQNAVDAEFQNYENYKKYRAIQERAGMTPDEYNYNQVYDYGTKQAVSPTATTKPATSSAASTTPATTSVRKAPSNTNSMDPNVAKKKAGMQNPNTYINQDYINSVRNQARGANGLPPVNVTAPADTMDTTTWPGVYAAPGTPKYDGSENLPYRMGGPYVLPMYQGLVGPSQVDEEAFGPYAAGLGEAPQAPQEPMDPSMSPYGPYADGYRFEPEQDEFEVGFDFGRTKKAGVNPYLPAMIRGAADYINNAREGKKANQYMQKMSRADQVFDTFDQDRGDYRINMGDFRPDQLVPSAQQGGPMMYDVADLFFLTPYMLKNTRGRR